MGDYIVLESIVWEYVDRVGMRLWKDERKEGRKERKKDTTIQ